MEECRFPFSSDVERVLRYTQTTKAVTLDQFGRKHGMGQLPPNQRRPDTFLADLGSQDA